MFYLNTIVPLFLFVEQLDQLDVCLSTDWNTNTGSIPKFKVEFRWNLYTNEQLLQFVEQLDKLEVCLPCSRLLQGRVINKEGGKVKAHYTPKNCFIGSTRRFILTRIYKHLIIYIKILKHLTFIFLIFAKKIRFWSRFGWLTALFQHFQQNFLPN